MRIHFVSKNMYKIQEVQELLKDADVEIISLEHQISEIQTEDVEALVRDKLLKAFKIVGRPVIVEHTGLYIEDLNHFPGGLTQIFWDKLQAETFTSLLSTFENPKVKAKTVIGYCDGKKIHFFEGEVDGVVSDYPRGNRDFQWDCIFIPAGHELTFAELGEHKNSISMRKIAFDEFKAFLRGEYKWSS